MKKQIGYIDVCPSLTWEPNEKYEYNIFYDVYNELSYGQAKFILTPESIEDFLKITGYLTSKGWFNKIIAKNQFICDKDKAFWLQCRKKRKVYHKEPTLNDFDNESLLKIKIIVDHKRLNEFRNLLKEMPEFRVTWIKSPEDKNIIII